MFAFVSSCDPLFIECVSKVQALANTNIYIHANFICVFLWPLPLTDRFHISIFDTHEASGARYGKNTADEAQYLRKYEREEARPA